MSISLFKTAFFIFLAKIFDRNFPFVSLYKFLYVHLDSIFDYHYSLYLSNIFFFLIDKFLFLDFQKIYLYVNINFIMAYCAIFKSVTNFTLFCLFNK